MICIPSLSIQDKKTNVFLVSNFLIFVSNRFAMLHIIFYKQSRLGDSAKVAYDIE